MSTAVHREQRTVRKDEMDRLGHVNNLVYIRWCLDAAVHHSDVNGWDWNRYQESGAAWVVRQHNMTYLRPAFADDLIEVVTAIVELSRVTCRRAYAIDRLSEGNRTRLLEGFTEWVFIDVDRGAPKRIPPDVVAAFPLTPLESLSLDTLRS